MPQTFDDAAVRSAMREFLAAADRLDQAAAIGGRPADLVELAERKAVSGMLLRRALQRTGWTPPTRAEHPAAN